MNAINFGNYWVVFDHKSRLGPNYWPLPCDNSYYSMLKCEKSIKIKRHSNKFIHRIFQYSQNIFFKNIRKNKILWGRERPSVTISGSEKARCGADSAATGQCSPPLHITELQNRCQKRPLLHIGVKKMMLWSKSTPASNFKVFSHWERFLPQGMFISLLLATC